MKNRSLKLLVTAAVLAIAMHSTAQKKLSSDALPVFTADSLASGNYKDILTSFFQLAFDNLTGPNKALNFSSNPYAVMLRGNPDLARDVNYYKYRMLRKLNFNFGLNLDTSYHFNGFSAGIKYALINQRDSTTSKFLFHNLQNDPLNMDLKVLDVKLNEYVASITDREQRRAFALTLNYYRDTAFSALDTSFRNTVIGIARQNNLQVFLQQVNTNPDASLQQTLDATFGNLKMAIKNKLLWTIAVSDTTYKDQFAFSNIVFSTELSKGIFKPQPGSNLELNIRASLNLTDDSLRVGRNLKRCILNFEPGVNWVIRNKSNDQSIFEFKLGGSYTHNFSSLYADEKRDQLMFAGVFRVRVFNDIWIPLDFKYDPGSGHVFGFLSVKANFTGMGKLINEMTK